jgi:thiol-disulfide isomerase/thioredoxin
MRSALALISAAMLSALPLAAQQTARFDLTKGATLPDFTWTAFDGSQHKFSELGGKVRLIDFWATWCVPCVADLASKKALYAQYHPRGFEILGVDAQERRPGAAEEMIAEKSLPWLQARFDHDLVETHFGVYAFPTFILVDRSGRIVSTSAAELQGDALNKTLAKLLPAGN